MEISGKDGWFLILACVSTFHQMAPTENRTEKVVRKRPDIVISVRHTLFTLRSDRSPNEGRPNIITI